MDFLEPLVKLASFGTAGVSVLAIFYIGYNVQKLPNDSPEWKPALMRKYMSMCVTIAIICAISGGANAYFNQGKIMAAEHEKNQIQTGYEIQMRNIDQERQTVSRHLDSLKILLRQQQIHNPVVSSMLDSTAVSIQRIKLEPTTALLNPEKLRQIGIRPRPTGP